MKSRIPACAAALLAAGAVSLAAAQTAQPSPPASSPSLDFVQEPIATATQAQGKDAQLGAAIVQALDADPSLKDSKITVQPENGKVTLTGATLTRAQKQRAGEIAIAQAGQGKVINAILDDQT
ncbi:MAG TPA: BON domain-containing protein [Usitatibacter sp.]|nr:BON domain-containing protein [Usitatibacter sp.]